MDFFKSVFSVDPDPSDSPTESRSPPDSPRDPHADGQPDEAPENTRSDPSSPCADSPVFAGGGGKGLWNFGGLIKTITSKSETVIQTYRRDLEEFSTGLKKETSVFREVASRAVRDLPGSLEVGASVAQESLESVGQAIDEFGGSVWRGTTEIITHGKEAILSIDSDSNSADPSDLSSSSQRVGTPTKRYSRFEAQVRSIQNDASTFIEEPEDREDFEKWRLSEFKLEEMEEETEKLLYENGTLEVFFDKFVPEVVDQETFWSRYFYRVYRLKQAEDARAKLVKRVIAGKEEEELSWEVDDDDDTVDGNERESKNEIKEIEEGKKDDGEKATVKGTTETSEVSDEKNKLVGDEANEEVIDTAEKPKEVAKNEVMVPSRKPEEEMKPAESSQIKNVEEADKVKSSSTDATDLITDDKTTLEPKSEPGESGKDSDFSVVSSQPSTQEEDDLGWDEIEDLGEHEDKKAGVSNGSPKKVDLLKRLSVAEDDEDLSWDIEDDDNEPSKP